MKRRRDGGKNSASDQAAGVKFASRSSSVSWPREKGRPLPNGVCSKRAQTPRRLGTTMTTRPAGDSTRQISFSVSRGFSTCSSEWTSSIRSMQESTSGSSSSKTSAVAVGPVAGQTTAPCVAGMKAKTRSASVPNRSSQGKV